MDGIACSARVVLEPAALAFLEGVAIALTSDILLLPALQMGNTDIPSMSVEMPRSVCKYVVGAAPGLSLNPESSTQTFIT